MSKETLSFLEYIETNKASDEYTERLNKDIATARLNKEWRVEYMKTLLHDSDVKREGRREGRVEERRIIVLNMLREGMNNSDICKLIGCNIEYIEEIRKDMES